MTPKEREPSARAPCPRGTPPGKDDAGLPLGPREFTARPLSERPAAELRKAAADYRRMAQTAATPLVMTALQQIADRLDALADKLGREEQGKP